jgi:hypothetical protein
MRIPRHVLTAPPRRPSRALTALRAVALAAGAYASFGCGGYSRQQVYAPLRPTRDSPVPVKINNRYDYVEFHLGDASLRIYHVVISERLTAVFGPAIIVPTPGAKETVQERPLEIDLHFDVRRGAVVALDPRQAMVRLADGRELTPEFGSRHAPPPLTEPVASDVPLPASNIGARADSVAGSATGQVVLKERFRFIRLVYNVPRVGLGSFTLHLPAITVNGRPVELPPVAFRMKRRGSNS